MKKEQTGWAFRERKLFGEPVYEKVVILGKEWVNSDVDSVAKTYLVRFADGLIDERSTVFL